MYHMVTSGVTEEMTLICTHVGVWMWTHITEKFKGLSQSHVQHAYTFSKELIKTVTEMLWRKHKHDLAVRDHVMLMWIVHIF